MSVDRLRARRPHPLRLLRRRRSITNLPTVSALSLLEIRLESIHSVLDLRSQVRTMESSLVHLFPTTLTIPPQPIHTSLRPRLLNHHTHRIREPDGIVRGVSRKQEELSLVDVHVHELLLAVDRLNGLEEHAAAVLVEELGSFVDVIVGAGVGAAHDHDGLRIRVDAVVVDGWLEEVRVLGQPFGEVEGEGESSRGSTCGGGHLGEFMTDLDGGLRVEWEECAVCGGEE